MKIRLMTVYVDDQDKGLRFYTAVLGFAKKMDVSQGPYRWLTLASAEEPDGAQLQLERNDNPAASAFQQARFQQGQAAAMFYTDAVQRDYITEALGDPACPNGQGDIQGFLLLRRFPPVLSNHVGRIAPVSARRRAYKRHGSRT